MAAQNYGVATYWNERYASAEEDTYDWYVGWEGLEHIFQAFCDHQSRIHLPGCGNGSLSQSLFEEGYKHVISTDLSDVVIKRMTAMFPDCDYRLVNVCHQPFQASSFDFVFDKGTLDAMLCGEGSCENAHAMMCEVLRTMAKGAVFVIMSYGGPADRLMYLRHPQYNWSIRCTAADLTPIEDESISTLDDDSSPAGTHYLYIMTKL